MKRRKYKSVSIFSLLAGCVFLVVALFAANQITQELSASRYGSATPPSLTHDKIRPGEHIGYYTAIANQALASKPVDYARAETASGFILLIDPKNIAAWNRLAFIDRQSNGHLTKDGIAALFKSYSISPYGDLDMMLWRVDFASANWTSLPDKLRVETLNQIPVIGRFGLSWDWRIRHCKTNPHKELYQAICAIAPGVVRSRD